jgi:tetratricopeptide (TPR) repeat protein
LLLHALCFYPLVTKLIPPLARNANSVDPDRAELAFWGASARYILGLPDRVADYGHADLSEFENVLASSPDDRETGQDLIYLENLHPVLESRTKEAIWLGDLDLALARALRVVELDPYDSKSWLELGQVRRKRKELGAAAEAYAFAAVLGPPASAIARHMAGVCFRELDQPLLAAFFFNSALNIDPLAMSAHEQIQGLPDLPAIATLKEWSLRSFDF